MKKDLDLPLTMMMRMANLGDASCVGFHQDSRHLLSSQLVGEERLVRNVNVRKYLDLPLRMRRMLMLTVLV